MISTCTSLMIIIILKDKGSNTVWHMEMVIITNNCKAIFFKFSIISGGTESIECFICNNIFIWSK